MGDEPNATAHIAELTAKVELMIRDEGTLKQELATLRDKVGQLGDRASRATLIGSIVGAVIGTIGVIGGPWLTGYFQRRSSEITALSTETLEKAKREAEQKTMFFATVRDVASDAQMMKRLSLLTTLHGSAPDCEAADVVERTIEIWASNLCGDLCAGEQKCDSACTGIKGLNRKVKICPSHACPERKPTGDCSKTIWKYGDEVEAEEEAAEAKREVKEQKAEEQKAEEQKAEEQKAEEQKAEEQKAEAKRGDGVSTSTAAGASSAR